MTAEERRIAVGALHAGPWQNHAEIIIAIADRLRLEPRSVEAVLQRLKIRQVLNCVIKASNTTGHHDSIRYEKGMDWTDEG
jgi:hypothetical protein